MQNLKTMARTEGYKNLSELMVSTFWDVRQYLLFSTFSTGQNTQNLENQNFLSKKLFRPKKA